MQVGPTRTDRRRDRYIRIACDICRRRKVKCSGGKPCDRCRSLALSCSYEEGPRKNEAGLASNNIVHSSIRSLEDQVATILERLNAPPVPAPGLRGNAQVFPGNPTVLSDDPILHIGFKSVCRLISVYENEVARMYPVVETESLLDEARSLFSRHTAIEPAGSCERQSGFARCYAEIEPLLLRVVLASAIDLDGNQDSEKSRTLFAQVKYAVTNLLMDSRSSVKELILLITSGLYHLQHGEDLQAWRLTRFAINEILARRLHTKEGWSEISDPREYLLTLRVFWSAYVIDMRNSFGNNMPPALGNADIDLSIPEPTGDLPYLSSMVTYSRIASKVWSCISQPQFQRGLALPADNGFLDFQITQWYEKLPPQSQFSVPETDNDEFEPQSQDLLPLSLRVSLYLRRNQMRLWLNEPSLQSVTTARRNPGNAQIAVQCAKDTIHALTHVARQGSMTFKAKPAVLDYFLASALAVVFPAVVHGPSEFGPLCEDGFHMALELITNRPEIYISVHLQRCIKTVRGFLKKAYGVGITHAAMENNTSNFLEESTGTSPIIQRDAQQVTEELRSLFDVAIACGATEAGDVLHNSSICQTGREAVFPDEVLVASTTDRNGLAEDLPVLSTMAYYRYDELSDILGDLG